MTDKPHPVPSNSLATLMPYLNRAKLIAFRVTKSDALADDALQDAFAGFLRQWPHNSGEESLRKIFFTAVHRAACSLLRAEKRRTERQLIVAKSTSSLDEKAQSALFNDEMISAAKTALDLLPLKERAAVSLHCEQSFSIMETAEILEIPKYAAARRIRSGLDKLRKIMARQGFTAISPAALGATLSSLPIPPVSNQTLASMQKMAANPNLPAKYAASVSAKAVSAGTGKTGVATMAWVLLVLAITATGVGLWGLDFLHNAERTISRNENNSLTIPPKSFDRPALFHRRWTFEKGPPADIEALTGEWRWESEANGEGGRMVCESAIFLSFAHKLPSRPLLFRAVVSRLKTNSSGVANFFLCDEKHALPRLCWLDPKFVAFPKIAVPFSCEMYFFGRHLLTKYDGKNLVAISELDMSSPADRLLLTVAEGFAIREIELRELTEEELPPELRDPKKTVADMEAAGVKPAALPPFSLQDVRTGLIKVRTPK